MSLLIMKNRAPKPVAPPIRLVLIDRYNLSRAGMQAILAGKPGFEVVGEAENDEDAVAVVEKHQPDVILMNIGSDGSADSLDRVPRILEVSEESRMLILMAERDPEKQHQAVFSGAVGVITMDKPAEILIKAIERVHEGEVWLDRSLTASVLSTLSLTGRARKINPKENKIRSLTERELEVIKLVGEGLKNQAIGERLFISKVTVHHHLTSIYSKLDVADRLELIVYAYQHGLAQLPAASDLKIQADFR
jgi:two-component system nitrate/nitrite response regulator NarL